MSSIFQQIIQRFRFASSSDHTVMILGLDCAGKTTLLYRLKLGKVVTTMPSIGFHMHSVDLGIMTRSDKPLRLAAWETDGGGCGGASFLKYILPPYLANSNAIIWVVDACDKQRLEESVQSLDDVLKVLEKDGVKGIHAKSFFPILILANKFDQQNALPLEDIQSAFSKSLSGRISAVYKTSFTSKTWSATGLPNAFEWLSFALNSSKNLAPPRLPSIISSPPVINESNPRSPANLAQRLESWLARSENVKDQLSDDELLARFRTYDLPEWDHYTHIRLAFVILTKYGRKEGKDMLFKGLEEYIANNAETKQRTFHLSMTYVWIQIVHFGIRNMPQDNDWSASGDEQEGREGDSESAGTAQATMLNPFSEFLVVNPYVADSGLWTDYYSKEVLMSPEAKAGMVLPDKKPLPNLVVRDAILPPGVLH
ncbi:hypothetical protein CVT24_008750 [Panaeolus cyanescens]|uniref:ADP-ribosylation factor n=1 Tax=Panaeolus cyanescens TaxID=181874 RepID=A0A409YWZ9_9AGAR|nr:hypothetical protein CVT24_008750 [Panaeolus cyanescens]